MEVKDIPEDACCIVFHANGRLQIALKHPKVIDGRWPDPPQHALAATIALTYLLEHADEVMRSCTSMEELVDKLKVGVPPEVLN